MSLGQVWFVWFVLVCVFLFFWVFFCFFFFFLYFFFLFVFGCFFLFGVFVFFLGGVGFLGVGVVWVFFFFFVGFGDWFGVDLGLVFFVGFGCLFFCRGVFVVMFWVFPPPRGPPQSPNPTPGENRGDVVKEGGVGLGWLGCFLCRGGYFFFCMYYVVVGVCGFFVHRQNPSNSNRPGPPQKPPIPSGTPADIAQKGQV